MPIHLGGVSAAELHLQNVLLAMEGGFKHLTEHMSLTGDFLIPAGQFAYFFAVNQLTLVYFCFFGAHLPFLPNVDKPLQFIFHVFQLLNGGKWRLAVPGLHRMHSPQGGSMGLTQHSLQA